MRHVAGSTGYCKIAYPAILPTPPQGVTHLILSVERWLAANTMLMESSTSGTSSSRVLCIAVRNSGVVVLNPNYGLLHMSTWR